MAELKKCRKCGEPVPTNAPFGHCPKCLLELGLDPVPEEALEPPIESALPRPPASLGKVRYFGDYELLEQIGRGGMGVVLKARQKSLNRLVALKMILNVESASPTVMARFHLEAEAAAKLDHPNIVPIYDVGEHEGQHYFSMKLVEGGSLAERIANAEYRMTNRVRGGAGVQFDFRHSASLISKVSRAVHHAHQRGVIHRDLKPGNILLDEKNEPMVADFGLAKLVGSELGLTQSIAGLGTPHYMPPEQAAGKWKQITVAADIYSLGAIFFELLTGRPPFQGDSRDEVIQKAIHAEPPRPKALNGGVDRDAETICLKCLEKNPLRRYRTAEELAEDLEAWRDGRPIQARPIGMWERAAKWVRRRPAIAALLGALIFTALLGVVGIFWKQRQTARALEESQRMARLLREASAALGPAVSTAARLRLLDGVAQRLETDLVGRRELQADVRDALGSVYSSIPDLRKSEAMFREALALRRKLHGDFHPEVASLLNSLAVVLQLQGRRADAEPYARESVEIFEKIRGADDPSLDVPRDNLAFFLRRLGKLSESEKHYRTALAVAQKRHGPNSREAALAVPPLVQVMIEQNKFAEGEPLASNAVRILQKELTNDWRTFDSISVWGATFAGQGKFDQAKPLLHSGYEGLERLVDISARLARTRRQEALWRLKLYYETNGPPEQAAGWRRQYEDWSRKVSEANDARAGKKPARETNGAPAQAIEWK